MDIIKLVISIFLIASGFFIIGYCLQQKEKLKQCDTAVMAKVINFRLVEENFKALKTVSAKLNKTDAKNNVPTYMAVLEYEYNNHTYTTKPTEVQAEIKIGSELPISIDSNDPEHFKYNDNDILTTLSCGIFAVVGGVIILVISIIRLL